MAVVAPEPGAKYGGVRVETDGVVTGFTKRGSPEPSYHFVGVQAVEARAFTSITPGVPAESVLELYPALIAAQHGSVRAFTCRTEFFDIGTPADYLRTSLLLSAREDGEASLGSRSRIDAGAHIEQSILWDDVEVGVGAVLRQCIVADGVRVPPGASWVRATLRCADEPLPGETLIDGVAIGPISPV
jgi:NDP-sugar pyrophosphorylase family protein